MPRSSNQKLKLMVLADIFRRETNEEHTLTLAQIIEKLSNNGIEAERKSIYSDIEILTNYGMDIVKTGSTRNTSYYLASSDFEIHELKLLADAVACSRFITEKKSRELIGKLSTLANRYDAGELKRNVIVSDRVKNGNEQIYYNVDAIQQAIREKKKIKFLYFDYDHKKNKRYHNDGAYSEVSPYALCWREENYYLVGYYQKYETVSNFRADKIEQVIICDEKRTEPPENFNLNEYTKKRFGMFSGDDLRVTLKVHNSLSGVIFDRFGKNTLITSHEDENYFTINQPVTVSPVFYSWVAQFGNKMEILSPEDIRDDFKKYIKSIYNIYK